MKLNTMATLGLSLLAVPALSGCMGAPSEGSDPVGASDQALTTVTLNAIEFGNWSQDGARTANNQLTGTVGGVEHAAYFVFDLTSVAGATISDAAIVVNNEASAFRENITAPKPGLRVTWRPFGSTSLATLTTGNDDTEVYQQIRDDTEDYAYDYITTAKGTTAFDLLVYDTDRIPAIVKGAKAGTQFALATWPSNVNEDTKVDANGTGDQFILNGVTTTPQLRLTLE